MNGALKALRLMAVAVLAMGMFGSAGGETLKLPPHEKVVLNKGKAMLLMEKHGVLMEGVAAIVKDGSGADPAGEEGMASITAGLLRKGTSKRSAQKLSEDLDFIGGTFGADSGVDYTSMFGEFLTKDADRGLDLISDALLHPVFPQAEVEKLVAQDIDGVKAAKDQAESVALTYYYGYLFGKHPYARPEGGDELSLARIKREAVVKFYEANYTPGNTILAVAGDFDAAQMRAKIEQAFGGWAVKTSTLPLVAAPAVVKGKKMLLIEIGRASCRERV